jgi:hypothetical protein
VSQAQQYLGLVHSAQRVSSSSMTEQGAQAYVHQLQGCGVSDPTQILDPQPKGQFLNGLSSCYGSTAHPPTVLCLFLPKACYSACARLLRYVLANSHLPSNELQWPLLLHPSQPACGAWSTLFTVSRVRASLGTLFWHRSITAAVGSAVLFLPHSSTQEAPCTAMQPTQSLHSHTNALLLCLLACC